MEHKYKRRAQQKTNYLKRLTLLKSGKSRLVARKSNLYMNLQYMVHETKGDVSKLNLSSKVIKKFGWEFGCNSIPACYLTGLLFGKLVAEKKLSKEVIFDIGLHRAQPKGKIFAALKGAIDSGLNLDVDEKMFPDADRLTGKHIKKDAVFNKVKENILKKSKDN
jgi:large subunit ribosomal protein L18